MSRIPGTATATFAAALAMALAPAASADAQNRGNQPQKRVYCWDDASGKRVCGDALPPEAADRARTEINPRTGMRTGSVARAPTAEERAAAEQAQAEATRREAEEAAQRRRELAMVESYEDEGELRRAYRHRIDLMEGAARTSRMSVDNLRQSLLGLLRDAGERELAGKPVPAELTARIRQQHALLRQQAGVLESQLREHSLLESELEDAVARYRELKRPAAASADSG
jgi:hypothetical protein